MLVNYIFYYMLLILLGSGKSRINYTKGFFMNWKDVSEAHRLMKSKQQKGKIVLLIE